MRCDHLGAKDGYLIGTCCGGKEKLIDLYVCNSTVRPERRAIPSRSDAGIAPVEIGGSRSIESVAGCIGCFAMQTSPQQPMPPNDASGREDNMTRRLWQEMRRKRERKKL